MVVLAFVIAAVVIAGDQLTKAWVMNTLKPIGDIPLWEGVFHFHYAQNTGASFGMLPGFKWVFTAFSVAASIAIIAYIVRQRRWLPAMLAVPLGLMLGGAIGNLIDRIRVGYVIDFLYFKLINFAIFNVADSCLVVGAILLAVYLVFLLPRHEAAASREGSGDETGLQDRP